MELPALLARTRVVMHHPFFPENIGAIARAMTNVGLAELHTVGGVSPSHENAFKLAVGSASVLENARVHEDDAFEDALAGASLVIGTTSFPHAHLRVVTPREASRLAAGHAGACALVFGNEKNGLALAELRRCDLVARIPCLKPGASLNLAQAAMVMLYEWLGTALESSGEPGVDPLAGWPALAEPDALDGLLEQLEGTLWRTGFYKVHNDAQRRAVLKRVATRLRLDQEELSVLRGLVSKLGLALADRER